MSGSFQKKPALGRSEASKERNRAYTRKRYREMILERVGTKDPTELVSEFLGRKPNSNAFLRNIVL